MSHKLTKIIATIGPASDSPEMITRLIERGVDIFRFNFKHNTSTWHSERIDRVNDIAKKLKKPVGTLVDLQGPEIRISIPTDGMPISEGELITLGKGDPDGKWIALSHPTILSHLEEGQSVLIDDGSFSFKVVKKNGVPFLLSETTGTVMPNKSMNIPGADFPFPVLVKRDFEGLTLASKHGVDFVALSFVRNGDDIKTTRVEMKKHHVKALLIAKIETQKALDDLDNIIDLADGVMVARGDLGVEVPLERVPYYQKKIIRKCIEYGKPVITATQMMQSMIVNPYPTRAEISDVANAVYDLTDAVMLSGETASGKYPHEVVKSMAKTVHFNEKMFPEDRRLRFKFSVESREAYLCDAAYNLYLHAKLGKRTLSGFLVFTQTGKTARLMSRYRPSIPVYAFTPDTEVQDQLTMNYGVVPFVKDISKGSEVTLTEIHDAIETISTRVPTSKGDQFIVLHGDRWGEPGGTSSVRIVEL